MIARVLALMLCASPVAAETHEWGVGTEGPSSATLTETDEGYTVTFANRLVNSVSVLGFDLGDVHVRIVSEYGSVADRMYVTPPPGFYCRPCDVVVDENAEGAVLLFPQLLG